MILNNTVERAVEDTGEWKSMGGDGKERRRNIWFIRIIRT